MKKLNKNIVLMQCEPECKLTKQKQELENYIRTPGAKTKLATDKDMNNQKLTQIKEALHNNGEIDPAYRLNKKYRKRSEGETSE